MRVPDWNQTARALGGAFLCPRGVWWRAAPCSARDCSNKREREPPSLETRPTISYRKKTRKLEMLSETRSCVSSGSAKKSPKTNSPVKTRNLLFQSVAARFSEPVARGSKILVPRLRKAGDDLLRGSPCDLHAGMNNISPGMHARPVA